MGNLSTGVLAQLARACALPLWDRTIPTSEAPQTGGDTNVFNLMLIVGLALVITVLARFFANRANRKK